MSEPAVVDATTASTVKATTATAVPSEPRRSSAEIVAVSTEMRQRLDDKKEQRKKNKGKKATKKSEKDEIEDAKRELVMTEHKMEIDELISTLGTDKDGGMTTANADKRRLTEGRNMLTPPAKIPEWLKLFHEMTGFFALLLWLGSILCFVAYGLRREIDNLYLGIVLAAVVIITGLFSYFQNRKSSDLMESFKNMMPTITTCIRDGKSLKLDASLLVRGDIIVLKGGDKVAADIRIIKCSDDTQVDNASLTGEAEPQKRLTVCTHDNPLETKNLCFFGTFVPQGNLTGVVVNIGDQTVIGRIAKLTLATSTDKTPIAIEIEHFVHIVSAVAIVLGITFFIIGASIGTDLITNLVFMIGIIVANVPEGLLATVTVALTLTARRMATKSVLVKNLEGVETLGSTTCICSDKTGTLTQNVMTVANLVYNNKIYDAECSITPVGNYDGADLSYTALQRCAVLCNNAVFDEESKFERVVRGEGDNVSIVRGAEVPFKAMITMGDGSQMSSVMWDCIGDASESAMIKFCQDKKEIIAYRAENLKQKEIPFNSKNKYQVSIHKQDNDDSKPLLMVMKGAPERITARCTTVLLEGKVVEMTPARLAEIEECQLALSKKGMRVLGFCEKVLDKKMYPIDYEFNTDNPNFPLGEKENDYTDTSGAPLPDVKTEEGLCFVGLMALIDPPRPQVPPAVEKCKTAGIRVVMVTGDHPITAKAIAHKVGILWGPTKEDVEEENAEKGLTQGQPGWSDPEEAPAIVVPGWTISLDTPVAEWDRILDHPQIVFARTSPQQKLIIVENFQRRNEIVAVTGDGVNDSPALKKADIGVAMGIMGSEVSKEAADMILLDDNFASIVAGVEEGRLIFDNLKKSIAYTLSSNIPEISPFLLFIILSIPLPLTTVLILAVDLGTDLIPAISMAYEKAESDIMLRAPRNAKVDRLVTKKLISFAYLQIGIIQAAAGFYTYLVVLNDYGFPPKILPGLGLAENFGRQVLFCKLEGGQFCSPGGKIGDNLLGLSEEPVCGDEYDATIPEGGSIYDARIWFDERDDGDVVDCQFALQNFKGNDVKPEGFDRYDAATYKGYSNEKVQVTYQSMQAAVDQKYVPYYPMRSRESSFFNYEWMQWDVNDKDVAGLGDEVVDEVFFLFQPVFTWGVYDDKQVDSDEIKAPSSAKDAFESQDVDLFTSECSSENCQFTSTNDTFVLNRDDIIVSALLGTRQGEEDVCSGPACLLDYRAGFTHVKEDGKVTVNVMSRQIQDEALSFAQGAFFVTIVVVQWADLLICKTRILSIRQQGLKNKVMNFGLMFETILAAYLCYIKGINYGLGTRNLRLTHWFPGMPFSMLIFLYDETRKFLIRSTSSSTIDKETGRIIRHPGWLERNTYY